MGEKVAGFIWYDLMTNDVEAAARFYGAVFGWEARDAGSGSGGYRLLLGETGLVGGLMLAPADAHASPPAWLGHIGVKDVDGAAARVKAAGGAVLRAPLDIPDGVGRFAVAADPEGAVFLLFCPGKADTPAGGSAESGELGGSGRSTGSHSAVVWRELHAGDMAKTLKFYTAVFGWTKGGVHGLGEMGEYWTIAADGQPVGGLMTKRIGAPRWMYSFGVDGVRAAVERVEAAGGTVGMGPREV
jgi:predicted enzyme related to lactoylglutathione lyase